jgi:hypothetical protein
LTIQLAEETKKKSSYFVQRVKIIKDPSFDWPTCPRILLLTKKPSKEFKDPLKNPGFN